MEIPHHERRKLRLLLVANIIVWAFVVALELHAIRPLLLVPDRATIVGIVSVVEEYVGWTSSPQLSELSAGQPANSDTQPTHTPHPSPSAEGSAHASSATPTATPTAEPTPRPSVHVVQRGETIYSIARTYHLDVTDLIQLNSLNNPNAINAGQELRLPTPPPPTPTATATATLPPGVIPTPAPTPTLRPVWPFGPYLDRNPLPISENLITVLLLGAEGTTNWRTDSIMLAMYNPDTARAGILSIPRDLWVAIPGYGYGRINTVDSLAERTDYPGGGPALLRRVLRENLGLSFDYYVRVHFDGFVQIIDTLGGVDVVVDCPLRDSQVDIDLQPGLVHMDGALALSYARSRYTTSDFDRARRQQQIIQALWQKGRRLDLIPRIPQLYTELNDTFVTDLQVDDVVQLARVGLRVAPQNTQSLVIDGKLTKGWLTPAGASVLLPNQENIEEALTEFFNELNRPPAPALDDDADDDKKAITIRIENRTTHENWVDVASARIEWAGGTVSDVTSNPQENSKTQLIRYDDESSETSETVSRLLKALQLDESRVEDREASPDTPDMTLILGSDFTGCRR